MKNYLISKNDTLINYLMNELKYSHKEAKRKLEYGQILINNKKVTQYNFILKPNDKITVNNFNSKINEQIDIIYENKDIIVVNKPSNLLTISTNKEKEKTLYHLVSDYLKTRNKNSKIFIIHRLDKETSGIVMFAKNEKIKNVYQNNWDKLVKYRGYYAVVEGKLDEKKATIIQYLKENSNYYVYSTNKENGKKAITKYEVMMENNKYSLLKIEIKTGRKNQIRVAMQSIGHHIIGDTKYGSKKLFSFFGLQANKLIIKNPITQEYLNFEININERFQTLFK